MLVRDAVQRQFDAQAQAEPLAVDLPRSLHLAGEPARITILKRLATSRRFALGARAGLNSAIVSPAHGGQRVIVKVLVSRHRQGPRPGAALARHIAYLGRSGAGQEHERPAFFGRAENQSQAASVAADWGHDRHHFRLIISPEHGERIADFRGYVSAVMGAVANDLREPALVWFATCHFDTDQPHAHVVVRGRRADGRDLVMPRAYISHGIRARAQEAAQERLGDRVRSDAERRVWRQTEANAFTQLDRRLIAEARPDGTIADGIGRSDAWAALTRGRLRHLEVLGLATRVGARYRLSPTLERDLRAAPLRMDVVRTLNQRRLEGARDIRTNTCGRVSGEVMASGFHDEHGAGAYVVVRDVDGVEHYSALKSGSAPLRLGDQVALELSAQGAVNLAAQRGADLSL